MATAQQPRYMSGEEKRLAKLWHYTDKVHVAEIARRLHRNESTHWDFFKVPDSESRGVGRKAALDDEDTDRLVGLVEEMVTQADTRWTVSMDLIQARFRPRVCRRVLQDALHQRKMWFHKLREKPVLTDEDVRARYQWAKDHHGRTPAWWREHVHLHIDNHTFKVPTTAAARRRLAARRVHGAYRALGRSLKKAHVKGARALRFNTGARGVLVAGGVGAGKVLLWKVVEETWCAQTAADLYQGPLKKALVDEFPRKRFWNVLEDNDPTGNRSRKAMDAKEEERIVTVELPKRSPDLNVMDYFIWAEVEKRLRKQEWSWPANRRETRVQFVRRLARVARALPEELVNKAIGDMARRVERLYVAKGGLFEEGGKTTP